MILGIDPSSIRTGYCVLSKRAEINELGVWRPPKRMPLVGRVESMVSDLDELLREYPPGSFDIACIEMPQERQARRITARSGAARGLALYGWAAGAIWQALRAYTLVMAIQADVWTRRKPKSKRTAKLILEYPQYRTRLDEYGGDAADALGIALFGLGLLKEQRAMDI